jgi:molecular chaperone GrpE
MKNKEKECDCKKKSVAEKQDSNSTLNEECTCEEHCDCGEECNCENECTCDCENDEMQTKLNEALNKAATLEDALLRSRADFVNYRKRLEDEQARNLKYCNEDLVKEFLPIIDNFERAIRLDNADLTDELSKFLEGFKMMYCNQVAILESYGVKAIDGNNKLFDSTYHQAIMTEHRDGVEPGMVLEVLQKGYLLKDKVIRHAMVKVSE